MFIEIVNKKILKKQLTLKPPKKKIKKDHMTQISTCLTVKPTLENKIINKKKLYQQKALD